MKKALSNTCARPLSLLQAKITVFAGLLAVLIVIPGFIHNQWITGPVVNASLIAGAMLLGPSQAILLGLIPSTVALSVGLLPLPLAPMVPFIMIANALFVLSFCYVGKHYFVGLTLASLFKFAFLHYSVVFVMNRVLQGDLVQNLLVMMSWPQFFTAFLGGVIAYPILKYVRRL